MASRTGNGPGRILVVGARGIPDAEGGAEKNAEQLFPRLVERGYDVTLIGLASHIRAPSYRGVKLISAPVFWLLKTDKLVYYLAAVAHAIRLRPRIVHLQGLGAALMLWSYKLLGFKVVVRYGSADYTLRKWGLVGRLGFLAAEAQLRFADAVISVADTLTRRLEERGIAARVHTIPNALDESEMSWPATPDPSRRPYILTVGRVTSQKNIETLLRAFAILGEQRPDLDLVIAGGLTDRSYVESLTPLLSARVKLLGAVPRSEVPALLRCSALFANISHHEGNSNSTLEAISYGCPVIVSDIGENHEMRLAPCQYVDRLDASAVAAAFDAALTRPTDFIVDRAGFPTWDDVALRTAAVYDSLS